MHERSRPVHELAAAFDISRPAISRHLKVLKDAGLVIEEKSGRENVYSLQRAKLKPMQDWLEKHRTARVTKRGAKASVVAAEGEPIDAPVAVAAAVPAPVAEPALVAEPGVPEPVAAAAEPEVTKPRRAPREKAPRPVVAAPPPAAVPQLSFFDL